jgi:hypothetical protein
MRHWYLGHDLKRSYRRNVAISWLVVLGLVCTAAVVLMSSGQTDGLDGAAGAAPQTLLGTEPAGRASAAGGYMGPAPDSWLSYLRRGMELPPGYIGRVVVVRDQPAAANVRLEPQHAPSLHDNATDLLLESDRPTAQAHGIGEYWPGGGDEFGLPPSKPLLPIRGSLPLPFSQRQTVDVNRRASLRLEPAAWPAKADAFLPRVDSGIVWLTCTLEADGSIAISIDSALPVHKGFEQAVQWSLWRSHYTPAVRHGRPVATAFRMTYIVHRERSVNWVESAYGVINASVANSDE